MVQVETETETTIKPSRAVRCPILMNYGTRKDGTCIRYQDCQIQGRTGNLEKLLDLVQTPVDWEGKKWKACPAKGRVLR